MLKEVAGTKVYEKKRQESMKIMDETDSKREKIVGFLDYIEQRLNELEEEKEELKEYQKSDRERRCLEYALHQRELEDVTATLETVNLPAHMSEGMLICRSKRKDVMISTCRTKRGKNSTSGRSSFR